MNELPVNHFEPFAATLGIMLYPGLEPEERAKADAFASQFLAKPIEDAHKA